MRALVPIFALAVIALAVVLVVAIVSRSRKARENRKERDRHELFLDHLYTTCLSSADVEPFARVVADQVLTHLTPGNGLR